MTPVTPTGASRPRTQHAVRGWLTALAVVGLALVVYIGVALGVSVLTGDAIAGAAASNIVAVALAIGYRRWSTGTMTPAPPDHRATTGRFWLVVAAAMVLCWTTGQAAARWLYTAVGSTGFDHVTAAKLDAPVWLVVVTVLVLAPLGEEALMRGVAYPALRRRCPAWVAALATAVVFAALHGNIVQAVLTIPLGVALAFVYEATQRLWPVVVLHGVFNLAASFIPVSAVDPLARPVTVIALVVVTTTALALMAPRGKTSAGWGRAEKGQAG